MVTVSVCKYCRREGEKLFLKGEKCISPRCPFVRRSYGPGQHGQVPRKTSDFAKQLREKQKAKRIYGVAETQFKNYFKKARTAATDTEEYFHQLLERRFDNVIYRLGFAPSRRSASQLISHGFFTINKKKLDTSSYLVKKGDKILPGKKIKIISSKKEGLPNWLKLDKAKTVAEVLRIPKKDEMEESINLTQIIEFYSK